MLKRTNSKQIVTLSSVNSKYTKAKVIFVITDKKDMSNIKGRVYAISKDNSSFTELCEESERLNKTGVVNLITGTYGNGGGIGVQYEV